MSTITLKVPKELKERVAALARRTGKTPHAVMLESIEETVRLGEARVAMVEEARSRFEELQRIGRGIDWHEMRAWLRERAAGRKARGPIPRPAPR